MSSYTFTKAIIIFTAFDNYLSTHLDSSYQYDGSSYSDGIVAVNTLIELTSEQNDALTTLVNDYVDPPYYLKLDHTTICNLTSINYAIDDTPVTFQTFIATNSDTSDIYLGSIKSVFEYHCDNVADFTNITSGSIDFLVKDITRNVDIISTTVNIDNIISQWNTLANSGSTTGSTIYKCGFFGGLLNKTPNYDTIWQLSGQVPNFQPFQYKINGIQYLYYEKLVN